MIRRRQKNYSHSVCQERWIHKNVFFFSEIGNTTSENNKLEICIENIVSSWKYNTNLFCINDKQWGRSRLLLESQQTLDLLLQHPKWIRKHLISFICYATILDIYFLFNTYNNMYQNPPSASSKSPEIITSRIRF